MSRLTRSAVAQWLSAWLAIETPVCKFEPHRSLVLCPWARHVILPLVPRFNLGRPTLTWLKNCWLGWKESNPTKKWPDTQSHDSQTQTCFGLYRISWFWICIKNDLSLLSFVIRLAMLFPLLLSILYKKALMSPLMRFWYLWHRLPRGGWGEPTQACSLPSALAACMPKVWR